jgi:type II secretory pathway component HofQ
MGRRRTHSEEFKREAVRLIRERGVTTAQASRDLGPLVQKLGSQQAAYDAVASAAQAKVASQGLSGVFETTVSVGGQNVVVRGKVIDDVARIGTFFIPE